MPRPPTATRRSERQITTTKTSDFFGVIPSAVHFRAADFLAVVRQRCSTLHATTTADSSSSLFIAVPPALPLAVTYPLQKVMPPSDESSEEYGESGVQRGLLLSTKTLSDRFRKANPFEAWREAWGEGYWAGGSSRVSRTTVYITVACQSTCIYLSVCEQYSI